MNRVELTVGRIEICFCGDKFFAYRNIPFFNRWQLIDDSFIMELVSYKKCVPYCGRRAPPRYALFGRRRIRGDDGIFEMAESINPCV